VHSSAFVYQLGANVENLTLLAGAFSGVRNALANRIVGNASSNELIGGLGADVMLGGGGEDVYYVDDAGDVVTELAGQGGDTVVATISYTLGANVEDLSLNGTLAINGTGNALGNLILGNPAANAIDGGAGADAMVGGAGNDLYRVDNIGDVVTEFLDQGTDSVFSTVSYSLSANVEVLVLSGAAINGTGNSLANRIVGNAAANALNGGSGFDTLIGGLGADTYFVDTNGDVIVETGADIDKVVAFASYILPANVENIELQGFASNATGNALANVMTGNVFGNVLDGKAGADTMRGNGGDDTYIVDNIGDVVAELAGQGVDIVVSAISYTLGLNVENLILTGASAINGTGNALANRIQGNSAANVLDGGIGADKMIGGRGSDTYVVDNVNDVVEEVTEENPVPSDGIDTVNASVTFTMVLGVENLNLTGASAIAGTGNVQANRIVGNGAANVIDGKLGADVLTGGLGMDTFVFSQINAADTITDFNVVSDTMRLSNAAFGNLLTVGGAVTLVSASAPVSAQAKPTFLYDTDDGRLFFDRDGTGAGFAPVQFAVLTGAPVITTADFVVVA
jgi:trimeric autotransporter adhesin